MEHAVVIASIGATAFIVFSMPNSVTAKPRRIIGGHLVGFISGSFFAIIPHGNIFSAALIYSIAVGVAFFILVITDTEHPPAAGTALGMAITGYSFEAAVAVFTSVIIFALIHYFAEPYLKDLV